jgi:hypothetical protein
MKFHGWVKLKFRGRKLCEKRIAFPIHIGVYRWKHQELFETDNGKYIVLQHIDEEYHDQLHVDMDAAESSFEFGALIRTAIKQGVLPAGFDHLSVEDFKRITEDE